MDMRTYSRKSLVAAKNLYAGEIIKKADLRVLRPGNGIAPKFLEIIVGMILLNDVKEGSVVEWTDLNEK